jgi:hypothetical protein
MHLQEEISDTGRARPTPGPSFSFNGCIGFA